MENTYIVYTDGACSNNQNAEKRIGAYAACIFTEINTNEGQKTYMKKISDKKPGATNNEMELTAAVVALYNVLNAHNEMKRKGKPHVKIISDSQYVVKGVNEWLSNWKSNNWHTKSNKPVSNLNLWKALDTYLNKVEYTFDKVKGDGKDKWNSYCDKAARKLCGSKQKK